MADVRSLLRQERAQRKQAQKLSATPAAAPASKKRKAADDTTEERKRTRTEESVGVPAGFFDPGAAADEQEPVDSSPIDVAIPDQPPAEVPKPTIPPQNAAAEAELDAFLDEMNKEPASESRMPSAFSGAVIEAAPMSAAELAAQAREEQSAQRARKDEEMEGEKEDAARALEDEFEEMEGLEERVIKLREQREALRARHMGLGKMEEILLPPQQPEDAEMSDDSDDEEWDDWRFRPA